MSIDRPLQPLPVPAVNAQQQDLKMRPRREGGSLAKVASNDSSTTRVKLSKLVQAVQAEASHDVDYDRIDKIRASMDAGELKLDPDAVAHALVYDIFQLS